MQKFNKLDKALTTEDGEALELTDEFFGKAKRGRPFLPASVHKEAISIRIDPDVLAHFKAKGKGWQSEMNDFLRKALITDNS